MRTELALGVVLCCLATACSQAADDPAPANGGQDLGAGTIAEKKASPALPPSPATNTTAPAPSASAPPAASASAEPVLGANPTVLLTCTKQGDPSTTAYLAMDDQKTFQWKLGTEQHTGTLFRANGVRFEGQTDLSFMSSSGHFLRVSLPTGAITISGQPDFACDPSTIKADADFLLDLGSKAYEKNGVWTAFSLCPSAPGGPPMAPEVTDTLDGRGVLFEQYEIPSYAHLLLEANAMTTNADGDVIYTGYGVREIDHKAPVKNPVRFTAYKVHTNADKSTVLTWIAENPTDNVVFEGCGSLQGSDYANSMLVANTKK